MANMLPRTYLDVSEGFPFAGHAARRILSEVMEMAPLNKICYGSDGFTAPETNFAGAMLSKRAPAQALDDLVAGGLLGQQEAQQAAGMILADNARELYRI